MKNVCKVESCSGLTKRGIALATTGISICFAAKHVHYSPDHLWYDVIYVLCKHIVTRRLLLEKIHSLREPPEF